jgi:hypothetical protein
LSTFGGQQCHDGYAKHSNDMKTTGWTPASGLTVLLDRIGLRP